MTDQTSRVRIATLRDVPGVLELCRLLHEENGLATMSMEKVELMVARAISRDRAVLGVIGEPDHLEGCISLVFDELWYSDDLHISELFNFVRAEHRRSGHAKAMIEFAKKFAHDLGLPLIIGVVSNERTEAKIRLYQRQLDKPAGAFFVYGKFEGDVAHVR